MLGKFFSFPIASVVYIFCIFVHTRYSLSYHAPCFYFLIDNFFFQGTFAPKSYYSIDRVFRNEAVDRTHLAEFHQIEGIPLSIKKPHLVNNIIHLLVAEET